VQTKLAIGGEFVDAADGSTFEVFAPHDGSKLADVAVVVVPGSQPDVEQRVLLDHLAVHRPDRLEVAVRGGEEGVEDVEADVLLVRGHGEVL
jgi:aldehyde dehydrogenase (NAD+)